MNYLTHFLIDHKKGNYNYNFGLALPDLVNVSKRGWRPEGHLFPVVDKSVNDIWEGFQKHFAADAKFHNSTIFDSNTKRLRKEFGAYGLNQPGIRLFFVAHVLLEILIDRHIVKTRRYIADQFYTGLELVHDKDIVSFFGAAKTLVPERFFEFYDKFKGSKYLYRYADDDGIFYPINRLLKRTGQPEFDPKHESVFNELVQREEVRMADEIEVFLKPVN